MATIYDVARRAGVTAATVSNVVSGKGAFGEETRARVLAAIEELGYRPNLVARSLARRRSHTLALLLPNIANPFYPEIALEVERIAGERGYHLLLCNTHYNPDLGHAHLEALSGRWVDGIVAMAGGLDPADVLEAGERGLPLVLCNWAEEGHEGDLPSVDVDFRHGGELAARHLLDLGHRRIGVIVQETSGGTPSHRYRLDGFRAALDAHGVDLPAALVDRGDASIEGGYRTAERLIALPEGERPSAIFATNDAMALGALEAAIDHGLDIPAGLSLVGFDDIVLGAHVRPPLTTIAIPKRELAGKAITLLLGLVGGADVATRHITVRPSLVVRRSTAAPRPITVTPHLAV